MSILMRMELASTGNQIFHGNLLFYNIKETEEFLETAITKLEDTAKDKLTVKIALY